MSEWCDAEGFSVDDFGDAHFLSGLEFAAVGECVYFVEGSVDDKKRGSKKKERS